MTYQLELQQPCVFLPQHRPLALRYGFIRRRREDEMSHVAGTIGSRSGILRDACLLQELVPAQNLAQTLMDEDVHVPFVHLTECGTHADLDLVWPSL